MATKALSEGCSLVPAVADFLRLYSMRFCPYSHRVRLVIAHKNIRHEIVNINLKHRPAWLSDLNYQNYMPIIQYKGRIVYESAICQEFLEDMFPEPRLMPTCPLERANTRLMMYNFDQGMGLYSPSVGVMLYGLFSMEKHKRQQSQDVIRSALSKLETELLNTNSIYFGGDQVSLLDYYIWPWFERLPAVSCLSGSDVFSSGIYPRLAQWTVRMQTSSVVQQSSRPTEWYTQFLASLDDEQPKYDYGLDIK